MKKHLERVIRHVEAPTDETRELMSVGTMPIPFFGNIETAEILTVGVNPASGEFLNRNWPQTKATPSYLELRLRNYFRLATPKPYRWFLKWEAGLNILNDSSYHENAAHLDLSPRATKPMRELPEEIFLAMVEQDLKLFFETISLCRKARVLLLAGTVTGQFYMNEFLQKHAGKFGFELQGEFERRTGGRMTCRHTLVSKKTSLPVFFFSCGPSYDSDVLFDLISRRQSEIISCL